MKRISLRFTLWVSLPLILAFGLTILAITSYHNTQVLQEKYKIMGQMLELADSEISASINTIRSLHSSLVHDKRLKSLMYSQKQSDVTPGLRRSLSEVCGEYRARNTSLLVSILPISLGGTVLDTIYGQEGVENLKNQSASFEKFSSSFAYGGLLTSKSDGGNTSTLTYYGSYYDMTNFEHLGYLAINIRANRFFFGLPSSLGSSFSQLFVLNNGTDVVYSLTPDYLENALSSDLSAISSKADNRVIIDGRTFLVYSKRVESYPSWRIVGLVDYEDMMSQTRKTSELVAGIFLIATCLLVAICFLIARQITKPILRINEAMAQISKGLWPKPVESHTNDEMHSLITGFNDMTESVQKLTESRVTEQMEKRRIETAMLQGQLALLQSQINPHFIHNTLNTMKYMALKAGNTELYETIVSFNNLLRASIDTDDRFATVADELSYLESYMLIQQKRYADAQITFRVWSDPEAAELLLPRLILQPLVENALFHGILPTRRPGRIDVTILIEDALVVSISDDGQGIEPQVLQSLMDGTYKNTRGYSRIGLRNVIDRVELYYPKSGKFYISSQPNLGTLIVFKIPNTGGEIQCTQ